MTGNRSIFSNFRHFNGGYIAFGSDSKGGSITGQGTVSNERMSIERVNYVKELDFNLMSVSQVCDQKHCCKNSYASAPSTESRQRCMPLCKIPSINSCVSTSTAEAEYIAASSSCAQVIWIQNQMLDYGMTFMATPIHIENMSAISITNNPVQHSKTKHIDIRYHFIRDQAEKKIIILTKVHTNEQYADLFTKPFDKARFDYLVESIGMMNFD
ncbi:hypothetical protein L1987_39012 [Smallanthus sonchifolius]|uniref:Uncharacterized protein n=1 Tax=Smallanthus sonchifolius TaxID=185202 RepID=A0ACB9HK86_9ASTR|nr:hypothetical protein L1987_39012 [Smallanthus sonchifolius]